jgi:CRP-like cAMP-binding protein
MLQKLVVIASSEATKGEPLRAVNPRIVRMDLQEQVELVCRVDIFESLPKDELKDILRHLIQQNAQIHLGAGELFYTPQEPDGKLFILTKGRVRIYRMEASREFTLEVLDAGTVFGEVSFTAHRLRDAYAQATEPSVLLAMERADVERLIRQKPQVGIRMISLLSERLHYYETRMQDVTLKEVPARLASLILFLVQSEGVIRPGEIGIPTRYTHEHLGTMIGANREAVTRAFGHLQDEGALQMRRRFIYVQDVEALERAAGRLLEEEGESPS